MDPMRQRLRADDVAAMVDPIPVTLHAAEPGTVAVQAIAPEVELLAYLPDDTYRAEVRRSVTEGTAATRLLIYASDGAVAAVATRRL